MTRSQIRSVLPFAYVIAIVLAGIFSNGKVTSAVVIVGAMVVGAGYVLLKPEPGEGRDRQRNRGRSGKGGIQDS